MSAPDDGFLDVSRGFLDVLGADGIGDEYEQRDHAVAGVEPRWVLLPASAEQCSSVLALCAGNGLAVVPAGLRRRLGQGFRPERLDVVLSTSRLDRIVDHAAGDLTVTVEAGASLATVNQVLSAAGQWLPFDPPAPEATTVGGLIATQATGPLRHAFGTVRESLIGLRAVLADGTLVKSGGRVVKNVAGYDLHRLLVGSFGTLAVVVEATFKCRPRPETTGVAAWTGTLDDLLALASRLAGSTLAPWRLELLIGEDRSTRLVAGFGGVPELVGASIERAYRLAGDHRGALPEELAEDDVARRIEEVVVSPVAGEDTLVVRAGVPPRVFPKWLVWAVGRLARESLGVRGHAHAGLGVVRLRIDGAEARQGRGLVAGLRANAVRDGGYLVIEDAPSSWSIDPWGPPPPGFEVMKRLKRAFDPQRTLSPGRFVGRN